MITLDELHKLAQLSAPARAFLSVYLAGPRSVGDLAKKFAARRRLLPGGGADKDEREYFDENVGAVEEYLQHHPLASGSLCLFVCRELDILRAFPLTAPVADHVAIDAVPFIRPLAELQEGHATAAVVVADNSKTRIFVVSMGETGPAEVIRGHIKNHVKVGGWSQQRYERRRDKELHQYALEIVGALTRISDREEINHIVMVGSRETLQAVQANMPPALRKLGVEKAVDLSKGDAPINRAIMALFREAEHATGAQRWEKIRTVYLQGGPAVIGPEEVLRMASQQRIEEIVIDRTFQPLGMRCRSCYRVTLGMVPSCPSCGALSLYTIGVFNEILDVVYRSGGMAHFTDPLPTLTAAGGIGALLRY